MNIWTILVLILLISFAASLLHVYKRAATLVIHISITAILFLSLTQYLAEELVGLHVTGPIVFVFTIIAMGTAALSRQLRVQWGTGLLVLVIAILSFRNADEITPLTQSAMSLVVPVILLALCVRIEVRTLLLCMASAGFVLVVTNVLNGEFIESRLTLAGANPIWMARMACLAILAVLFTRPTRWRSVNWTIAAALAALIWLTGSRGPTVAVWGALLIFWALRTAGRIRALLLVGALIASLTTSAMLGGVGLPARSNGEANTEWRLAAWQQALQLWSSRPIFGFGTPVDAPAIGLTDYPHNAFVELLVQAGLAGLGILVVLMWLTWRHTKSAEFLSIFAAALIFSAFSGSLWGACELWLFALIRVNALSPGSARPHDNVSILEGTRGAPKQTPHRPRGSRTPDMVS